MAGCLRYLVLWPISIPELDGFLTNGVYKHVFVEGVLVLPPVRYCILALLSSYYSICYLLDGQV
jgi:hypothetical protein